MVVVAKCFDRSKEDAVVCRHDGPYNISNNINGGPNFATFLSPLLQFYLLFCHMYPLFYNLYPLFQFIKTLGAKLNILTDTNCKKEDEY